jgi:hypothetical protein
MILRLNYSNLVLPPFHHSVGIWLTDTYSIGFGNTAPVRVSSNGQTPLHSPVKFYLSLSGFHASPNSSRARECNCLYYATHTSEQGRKFHSFLCAYIVKVTACSCGDFQRTCISKRKTQSHYFNFKPGWGRTHIYYKRDKHSDIIFFNFFFNLSIDIVYNRVLFYITMLYIAMLYSISTILLYYYSHT